MKGSYLDVSTVHLTRATREVLDLAAQLQATPDGWPLMMVASYTYGWVISVPDFTSVDTRIRAAQELPKDLFGILEYAAADHCRLVCLDAYGYTLSLPTYDEEPA